MIKAYKECTYDENDEKFKYLSNFTKFTMAKNSGLIGHSFWELLEFLKYEREHQNRLLIVQRLLSLAFSEYKDIVAGEIIKCEK